MKFFMIYKRGKKHAQHSIQQTPKILRKGFKEMQSLSQRPRSNPNVRAHHVQKMLQRESRAHRIPQVPIIEPFLIHPK